MARDGMLSRLLKRARNWMASFRKKPETPSVDKLQMPEIPSDEPKEDAPPIASPVQPTQRAQESQQPQLSPDSVVRVTPQPVLQPQPEIKTGQPKLAPQEQPAPRQLIPPGNTFNVPDAPVGDRSIIRREELEKRQESRVLFHETESQGRPQDASMVAAEEKYRRHQPSERRLEQLISNAEDDFSKPTTNKVRIPPELAGQNAPPPPPGFELLDKQKQASGSNDKPITEKQGEQIIRSLDEHKALLSGIKASVDSLNTSIQGLSSSLQNVGGVIA